MIRKRQQVDSFRELPKDKQPPEFDIWWGYPESLEIWLERVLSGKQETKANIIVRDDEIE